MRQKTHFIVKIACIVICMATPILRVSAMDSDDFSSLFEGLFSGEDNPFLEMLNQTEEREAEAHGRDEKKDTKPVVAVQMPTKERLEIFENHINGLLEPLGSLIKNLHFDHVMLGGAVYEKVQHQRPFMTALESTLLHLQSIQQFLPAKEIEPFIKIFDKENGPIAELLNEILTNVSKTVETSIDSENAFILGTTDKSPVFMPTASRRKLEAKINALAGKIKPLTAGIDKLLAGPEVKKLFPEQKAAPAHKSSQRSSSHYSPPPYRPSQNSGGRQGATTRYNDNSYDPYGSQYSSDYPYGYPDDMDYQEPAAKKEEKEAGPGKPADEKPKDHKADLPELVAELNENETIIALQDALKGGSMLVDADYFSRMATTFEALFRQSPDGGLSKVAKLLKGIEKEKQTEEESTRQEAAKIKHTEHDALKTGTPSEKETKKQAQNEALLSYNATKTALAKALVKLLYTPTKQRVIEQIGSRSSISQKPILVAMLPEHEKSEDGEPEDRSLSRNILDQENAFCQSGQKNIGQFLEGMKKKPELKSFIAEQTKQLHTEIDQFEARRAEAIKSTAATIKATHLAKETLPKLQQALDTLIDQAYELRFASPTGKTCEIHFYNIAKARKNGASKKALSAAEEKALADGKGTTRSKVTKALNKLTQDLLAYKPAQEAPQSNAKEATDQLLPEAERVEILKESLQQAQHDWQAHLVLESNSGRPEEQIPEQPEKTKPGISAQELQKLMQAVGGGKTGPKK